jgi:hypothetical protein
MRTRTIGRIAMLKLLKDQTVCSSLLEARSTSCGGEEANPTSQIKPASPTSLATYQMNPRQGLVLMAVRAIQMYIVQREKKKGLAITPLWPILFAALLECYSRNLSWQFTPLGSEK